MARIVCGIVDDFHMGKADKANDEQAEHSRHTEGDYF
jgi:hypothetical protein